jgi:hypothetical protein
MTIEQAPVVRVRPAPRGRVGQARSGVRVMVWRIALIGGLLLAWESVTGGLGLG